MVSPVTVTVTGAAGNIGYAMAFRIASGRMLGPQTPVRLRLLDIPAAARALDGMAMELMDCSFDLLADVETYTDTSGFDGTQVALLVGSRPRTPGMARRDLLEANAPIFTAQGKALNSGAADDIRIVVVGNPANTNAYIAACAAPDIPADRFSALTRLDHSRAVAQLAEHNHVRPTQIKRLTIWGNHSSTQYPDVTQALVDGRPALEVTDPTWLSEVFVPTVAERGAAVLAARGSSSAGSAAHASIEHIRSWVLGTPEGDWTSSGLISEGWYGVPEGIVCSFPVVSVDGRWSVVEGIDLDARSRALLDASVAEIEEEHAYVRELGLAVPRP